MRGGTVASATGLAKARYRITEDRVWIDTGLLGTRTESVPLWSVKDMDVRQAVWQRSKDVGDVVLTLEDPSYANDPTGLLGMTGMTESAPTSGQVVLDDVEAPYSVVELITPLISEARSKKTMERQSQYVHHMTPPQVPAQAPSPEAAVDVADQLRKLAELRDQGILTDEEFSAQKSKLLGV